MASRYLTLALVAAACTGADKSLGPSDFVGSYEFQTINTQALPVRLPAGGVGCTSTIQAGTLVLRESAFVLYVTFVGGQCPGLAATQHTAEPIGGGVSVDGEVLRLRAIDPTSSTASEIDATLTVGDGFAELTLPAGALGLTAAAVVRTGVRVPLQ